MRWIMLGIMAFGLSACAQSGNGLSKEENRAALNAMATERDDCLKNLPEQIGNYIRRARCINTAMFNYTARVRGDYSYAQRVSVARSDLAAKIDSREISPQEGAEQLKLKLAEINASEAQYLREKDADDQNSAAERRIAAYQAVFGGRQPAAAYQAPIPQMGSMGATVNCSSYAAGSYVNTSCR